jgi:hypothetical protein
MKQAIIDDDGLTVKTVIMVDDDSAGPLVLPDEAYVGPGMLWDQSTDEPLFTYAVDLGAETNGLWARVKSLLGVGTS